MYKGLTAGGGMILGMIVGLMFDRMVLGMIFGMLLGADRCCRSASAFPLRLNPRQLAARPPDAHEPPDLRTARTPQRLGDINEFSIVSSRTSWHYPPSMRRAIRTFSFLQLTAANGSRLKRRTPAKSRAKAGFELEARERAQRVSHARPLRAARYGVQGGAGMVGPRERARGELRGALAPRVKMARPEGNTAG